MARVGRLSVGMVLFFRRIWVVIIVDDVRAKYAALQGRNIRFLSEPFRIRTGWAVEFFDPSGNRLGFVDYRE